MSGIVSGASSAVSSAVGGTVDAAGNIIDEAGNIVGHVDDFELGNSGVSGLGPGFSTAPLQPLQPVAEEVETGVEQVGQAGSGITPDPTAPGGGGPAPEPATAEGEAGSESAPAPTVADEDADIAAQEAFKALMSRFGRRQTLLGGEGEANVFRQTLLGG